MNALASISQLQFARVWEQLLLAQMQQSPFGGAVAEIYIYTLMPHTPAAAAMPESAQAQEAYRLANHALMQVCELFENEQNVRVVFRNGTAWIPIEQLADLYLETHRLHVRCMKNE
jgi:hypothetical protein